MTQGFNQFGQAIGEELPAWSGAKLPPCTPIPGKLCRIEPLNVNRHSHDLFEAFAQDRNGELWTYMTAGPFAHVEEFQNWMEPACQGADPLFHAIIDLTNGKAVGMAAYMRIKPDMGVIEIGSISYSPALQRTAMATEAMYLFMKRVFDELGYRRYEWKCDALNAPSRQAAERLGFSYEGLFNQAMVYKGRNRDTAWYAMLDSDWPAIKKAYLQWLNSDNFEDDGRQKIPLGEMISRSR